LEFHRGSGRILPHMIGQLWLTEPEHAGWLCK